MPSNTLTVSQYLVMGLGIGIFAVIGFRRGASRELLLIAGIGLGMLAAQALASSLAPVVSKYYRLAQFAITGGINADDPGAAWQEAKNLPALIEGAREIELFGLALFGVITLLFFLAGQWWGAKAQGFPHRLLGMLFGAVSGFLIMRFALPILLVEPQTVIALPAEQVNQTLINARTVARVAVFFVCVLIALGLFTARGGRGAPMGGGRPGGGGQGGYRGPR